MFSYTDVAAFAAKHHQGDRTAAVEALVRSGPNVKYEPNRAYADPRRPRLTPRVNRSRFPTLGRECALRLHGYRAVDGGLRVPHLLGPGARCDGYDIVASLGTSAAAELFLTTNAGEIRCEANASKLSGPSVRKSAARDYHWRHGVVSTPVPGAVAPVPAVWVNDEATPLARTLITGIPALTYVAVQVAVKDSVGQSEWSQPVIILVTK
jgi:hypothetical protein